MGQKLLKLSCNKKMGVVSTGSGWIWSRGQGTGLGPLQGQGRTGDQEGVGIAEGPAEPRSRPGSEWSAEFRAAEGSSAMRKMRTVHGF